MRRLVGLLLLSAGILLGAYPNGYTYRRSVTVDRTKVPNTDQVDFPVLFSGTYSYLAHTTGGGLVTDLNGYDIAFYSDAAGTTPLFWEIESYDSATGTVIFWVKTTVTTAANHVFYLFYANAAVNTFQSTVAGVWNANFQSVHHLAGNISVVNSSSGSGIGNLVNQGAVTSVAGRIGNGGGYTDAVNQYLDYPAPYPFLSSATTFTISAWTFISTSGNRTIFSNGWTGFTTDMLLGAAGTTLFGQVDNGSDGSGAVVIADLVANWKHIVMVYDGSQANNAGRLKLYVNGQPQVLDFGAFTVPATSAASPSGHSEWGAYNQFDFRMNGVLDELRASTNPQTADWVATEYNSQFDPATFYALGNQNTSSATARGEAFVQ